MAGLNGHSHKLPLKNSFIVVPGRITSRFARQQIFTCQVFTEQGALLWRLEDVIFRKVAGHVGVECHGHGGGAWRQAIVGQVWGVLQVPSSKTFQISRFPAVSWSWSKPCLAEPAQRGLGRATFFLHYLILFIYLTLSGIADFCAQNSGKRLDTSLGLEVYQ